MCWIVIPKMKRLKNNSSTVHSEKFRAKFRYYMTYMALNITFGDIKHFLSVT